VNSPSGAPEAAGADPAGVAGAGVPQRPRGGPAAPGPARRLLWLFLLALAVRLVYLIEIRDVPLIEHPVVDARAYDAWAQRIAAGDWFGDEVFYQAPAYPYFLALVFALFGHSPWGVLVVQMLMGAGACVLVVVAGRHFVGDRAALVAGLLLALYPPAIFFDGKIQKAALATFLSALLLYVLSRVQSRPGACTWCVAGVVLGALSLTRENALLLVPVVLIWIWFRFRGHTIGYRVRWAGAFVAGAGLLLVPVAARNYHLGGAFAPTTSQMGTNFYLGNNERATGVYYPLIPGRADPDYERRDATDLAQRALGRSLTAGEVSNYWMGKGLDFIRMQPGGWLRLMVRKFLLVWNAVEIPDVVALPALAERSWVLKALGAVFHFGTLAPVALAGIVLSWPRRRDVWLLYLLAASITAGIAVFHVYARFRMPMVPILTLLAGAALVRGAALLKAGRLGPLVLPCSVLAVGGVLANLRLVSQDRLCVQTYVNMGIAYAAAGRHDDAEAYYRRATEIEPDNPAWHKCLGVLRAEQGRFAEAEQLLRHALALDPGLADVHTVLADVLGEQGRRDEAMTHYRTSLSLKPDERGPRVKLVALLFEIGAAEEAIHELEFLVLLDPSDSDALTMLISALRRAGREEEARQWLAQAYELAPRDGVGARSPHPVGAPPAEAPGYSDPEDLLRQGARLLDLGRPAQAIDLLRQSIAARPDEPLAHFYLGDALAVLARYDEAVAAFRRSLELKPDFAQAHHNLAMAHGWLEQLELAEKHYREAVRLSPDMISAHYNLSTLYAHQGRFAEAAATMETCLELATAAGREELIARVAERLQQYRAAAAASEPTEGDTSGGP